MGLYSRALRHVDMNHVKELRENKIKQKKIAEEIREQIREELRNLNSPEFSNWRHELNEMMTTSDVFYTTLPATGDVDLNYPNWNPSGGVNYSVSGGTLTITNDGSGGPENGVAAVFDTSKYDTLFFDVTLSGVTGISVYQNGVLKTGGTSSGTYSISVSQSSTSTILFVGPSLSVGTITVNNLRFQRRTPLNVFVGLDSPEASSFMRVGGDSSPEERKQKLKEMLESSDEYLAKMFGDEFPGTGLDPKVGESGVTPGVEIAQLNPFQLRPDGTSGYNKPGDIITDPASGKTFKLTPSGKYGGGNEWVPVKQASDNYQDTQIAVSYPRDPKWMRDLEKMYKQDKDKPFKPGTPKPGRGMGDTWEGPLKDAKKKQSRSTMVAHHEPQGQVLSEKKLKSPEEVLKKIPGYYDGKPSPLGFPVEPPPKMVNGYHPDLVDGKKVADRFNRLDPISAKAMPPTGNPHIDKKVKAAAKKSK